MEQLGTGQAHRRVSNLIGGSWLGSYNHRKLFDVTAGVSRNNYVRKLTIHKGSGTDSNTDVYLDGNCKDDFGDIRVTLNDGVTEQDHYRHTYISGDYAVFYIKFGTVGTSSIYYFLYFDDDSAESASDSSIFSFFDDLTDASNWNGWGSPAGYRHTGTGNPAPSIRGNGDGNYHSGMVKTTSTDISDGISLIFDGYKGNNSSHNWRPGGCGFGRSGSYSTSDSVDSLAMVYLDYSHGSSSNVRFYVYGQEGVEAYNTDIVSYAVWREYEVCIEPNYGVVHFFVDGSEEWVSTEQASEMAGWITPWSHDPYFYFDNFKVRQYIYPEPEISWYGYADNVSFITNRKLANTISEVFNTVRRTSESFSHITKTLRLFLVEYLGNTSREIQWSLAPYLFTKIYKGEWDNSVTYSEGDIIWHNDGTDKTYKAVRDNSNKTPSTEPFYWEYLYNGQHKFIIDDGVGEVSVLVVAGGGGGGWSGSYGSGGGGSAGGLIFIEGYDINKYIGSGEISITVGAGGNGGVYSGSHAATGSDSSFGDLLAKGGGGGGTGTYYDASNGYSGGSGGSGGGWNNPAGSPYHWCGSGGAKTQTTTNDGYPDTGFGYNGLNCWSSGSIRYGSGGSGAGGQGYHHGAGAGMSIWDIIYAAGGDTGVSPAANGQHNTGSGGEGNAYAQGSGGNGGSGIVIVKYTKYHAAKTVRRTINYFNNLAVTVRLSSVFADYIGKTLRLFKAVYTGKTYREVKKALDHQGSAVRKVAGPVTFIGQAVRRLAAPTSYIAATFRYVGELVADLVNKIKIPPS